MSVVTHALSWAHCSTMWMNACVSISPLLFLKATVICQEINASFSKPFALRLAVKSREKFHCPVLDEQDVCITQAVDHIVTHFILIHNSQLMRFPALDSCHGFLEHVKGIVFSFSDSNGLFNIAAWISDSTVFNSSHRSQRRSWVWSQLPLKLESVGSFRAYLMQ